MTILLITLAGFVCFLNCFYLGRGRFVPLDNFSLKWRRRHYRCRVANFDLCSALMAIEQWGLFSMPHLLRHGASVYNGHFRGPMTLTFIAERLAVDLSLSGFFFDLGPSRLGFEHPTFRLRGQPTALSPRSNSCLKILLFWSFWVKFRTQKV